MRGVKFGIFHSYSFYNLILNSKEIGSPEVKTNHIEIPGADGYIDFTNFFGEPKYKNRKLVFHFTVNHAVGIDKYLSTYQNVHTILHGKAMKITLDEDPDWYYYGVVHVGDYQCNRNIATFDIECDCEPYRIEAAETVVSQYVDGVAQISLYNSKRRVVPTITSDSELLYKYDGVYYNPGSGTFTIPEIELKDGYNYVEVTGVGNVTFTYRKGRL